MYVRSSGSKHGTPYCQGGPKTWQFDATFFLSRKTEEANGKEITEATSARLRYFNANDLAFCPLGLYVVHGEANAGLRLDRPTPVTAWVMLIHLSMVTSNG
jgi:hypothetical protein